MTNIITELRNTVNTHHAAVVAAQAEVDKFQRDWAGYYSPDTFAPETGAERPTRHCWSVGLLAGGGERVSVQLTPLPVVLVHGQ